MTGDEPDWIKVALNEFVQFGMKEIDQEMWRNLDTCDGVNETDLKCHDDDAFQLHKDYHQRNHFEKELLRLISLQIVQNVVRMLKGQLMKIGK